MLTKMRQWSVRGTDEGATLVVVVIVMLVLFVGAVAVAALVTNTLATQVTTRGTAQSRAAADAGISAAVAGGVPNPCPTTSPMPSPSATPVAPGAGTDARYTVTAVCTGSQVTFTSVGRAGNGTTTTQAVYGYAPQSVPGTGADMIFFANTTFTDEVVSHAGVNGTLLSIVIPGGDFTCQTTVPANVIMSGDFVTGGRCDVQGDVYANGRYNSQQTDTIVEGNATAASTVTGSGKKAHVGAGLVKKNLTVGGDLNLGQGTVNGNVLTGGKVTASGTVGGTTTQYGTKPAALDFSALGFSWFDYAYQSSDWVANWGVPASTFEHAVTPTGTGNYSCNAFNTSPGGGWTNLSTLSASGPVAIDARKCTSGLSSNMGTNPVITLSNDLVLTAGAFDLTTLTINAAPGKNPRVWIIVDDAKTPGSTYCTSKCAKNGTPDIPSVGGGIKINGTVIGPNVTAMAYTPGVVDVRGGAGGIHDQWRGAFYGGSFNYGGGLDFWGGSIALPGQTAGGSTGGSGGASGTNTLGALISRRDVP